MIRINLLPVKQTEQAARQRRELMRIAVVLGLLLFIFMFARLNQARKVSVLETEIVELEQAVAALESKVKDVADLDEKKKALDARLGLIAELGRKRVGPVGVLHGLSRAIPDRVWLTDFTEAGGAATITGQATDNQTLADFLRQLAASPYFTTVDLVESTQELVGENRIRKFILKATINYAAVASDGAAAGKSADAAGDGKAGSTAPPAAGKAGG
jgi:type IV pilus assembly protein PilN